MMTDTPQLPAHATSWLTPTCAPDSACDLDLPGYLARLSDAWQILPVEQFRLDAASIWRNSVFEPEILAGAMALDPAERILHILGPHGIWTGAYLASSHIRALDSGRLDLTIELPVDSDLFLTVAEYQLAALASQPGWHEVAMTVAPGEILSIQCRWRNRPAWLERAMRFGRAARYGPETAVALHRLSQHQLDREPAARTPQRAGTPVTNELPAAAIVVNRNGDILEANQPARVLLGNGTNLLQQVASSSDKLACAAALSDSHQSWQEIAMVMVTAEASLQPVTLYLKQRDDHSILCLLLEGDEQAQALRQQVRALERQLAIANQQALAGQLAAGVAHDLRNLLVIAGEHAGPAQRELDQVLTEAGVLTAQLLDLSRERETRFDNVDLANVVKDLLPQCRHLAGHKAAIRFSPDTASYRVTADPTELKRVILNLVKNAADAITSDGVIEIELDYAQPGSDPGGAMVVLTLSDNGAGIPAAVLPRIFDSGFSTKGDAGNGLGLAMARQVLVRAGGDIRIESETGSGTRVLLYLPRAPIITSPRESHAGPGDMILVADHVEARRQQVTLMLRAEGFRVSGFDSAEDLIGECIANPDVALVVTDTALPGHGGEALNRLLPVALPRIFTTRYPVTATHNRFAERDGVTLVCGPLERASFVALVRQTMAPGSTASIA